MIEAYTKSVVVGMGGRDGVKGISEKKLHNLGTKQVWEVRKREASDLISRCLTWAIVRSGNSKENGEIWGEGQVGEQRVRSVLNLLILSEWGGGAQMK